MLFFISFFQNAQAYCGSEPIIEHLTCSSIRTGQIVQTYTPIDSYYIELVDGSLNYYQCDLSSQSLANQNLYCQNNYWDPQCASYTPSIYWDQSGEEDVYSFTCQQNGLVTARITNLDCDLDLYVLDSTCNPQTGCVAGSDNFDYLDDYVSFYCAPGNTYYIVVEGFDYHNGACEYGYDLDGDGLISYEGNYTLFFDIGQNTGCTEDCADGNDNDGDGFVDCDDSDCLADPFCVNCDIDGDGFSNSDCGGSDCNDSDVSIYPTANEICDGIDQDCDGVIDDGAGSLFFIDADGDGYGNAAYAQQFCTPPPGYSALPGDCNDGMANMSPALQEICDNIDNDCNGIVDDGMEWYGIAIKMEMALVVTTIPPSLVFNPMVIQLKEETVTI